MWTWDQSAGTMSRDGHLVGTGYSGADLGRNNPAMQDAVGIGPIPAGLWTITGVKDSPNTGPYTLVLEADEGTDTCGRDVFRIHGDSLTNPGHASHGCIVVSRAVRTAIWTSDDRKLEVIA